MTLSLFSDWYSGDQEIKSFVREDGQPAFQASHVCKVLGYSNSVDALMYHTDEDERFKVDIGKTEQVWFVTESGLYGLVFGSQKPIAKNFKRWLRKEVLPKLRASGGYIMPNATSDQIAALVQENRHKDEVIRILQNNRSLTELARHFQRMNLILKFKNKRKSTDVNHVMRSDLLQRWEFWISNPSIQNQYIGLDLAQISFTEIIQELDRIFQLQAQKPADRMHIRSGMGGDIENAALVPLKELKKSNSDKRATNYAFFDSFGEKL